MLEEFATIDHERMRRTGFPEVIFCPGKSNDQIAAIAVELASRAPIVMATRATPDAFHAVRQKLPAAVFFDEARIIALEQTALPKVGSVAVVSAGTSDGPVAAEAAVTLALMGNTVEQVRDVGVAGLHRVLARCDI